MKRILIFSIAYLPKLVGGAEVAIREITDRISDQKVQFDMITLRLHGDLPRKEKIGNVTVYRIGFTKQNPSHSDLLKFPLYLNKILFPPMAFAKALQLSFNSRYDLFWGMMSYASFPIAFLKFIFWRTPYLLTLQEGDPFEHVVGRARIKIVYPIYWLVFKWASAVQSISKYLAEFAKQMGFAGKSVVIPNGVDIKKFSGQLSEEERQDFRKQFGSEPDLFLLVTASRMVLKNANDDVIKSLALLPKNVKFILMGDGPDEVILRSLADKLDVADRVFFVGRKEHDYVSLALKSGDAFIRPSLSEGQGNSFIEAMAAGLPIIATPVGGIVDFLKDKETGMACEVRNPKSIARVVLEMQNNPELVKTIKSNASRLVITSYDWNQIAGDMKNLFFSLMEKDPSL